MTELTPAPRVPGTEVLRQMRLGVRGGPGLGMSDSALPWGSAGSDGEGAAGHAVHLDPPADPLHHLQPLVGAPAPCGGSLSVRRQPVSSGMVLARRQGRERSEVKTPLGRARVAAAAGRWAARRGQGTWSGGIATLQNELSPQTLKVRAVTWAKAQPRAESRAGSGRSAKGN